MATHSATARPAATHVVEKGKYNFDQNVLALTVVTTMGGTSERKVHYFDVTSLNLTRKTATNPREQVELLGARTKEAMAEIMPKIIANIKAMPDISTLLGRVTDRTTPSTKELYFGLENEPDISATEAAMDAAVARPDPAVATIYKESGISGISTRNLDITPDGLYELTAPATDAKTKIDNPRVIRDLLRASSWQDMIKDVDGVSASEDGSTLPVAPKDPKHDWVSTATFKTEPDKLTSVLKTFKEADTLLDDACKHYQTHLAPMITPIDARVAHIDALITRAQAQLQRLEMHYHGRTTQYASLNAAEKEPINQYIAVLQKSRTELVAKKDELVNVYPRLHRELAIIFATKRLIYQQQINKGEAPVGTLLSQEWDDLVSRFELADKPDATRWVNFIAEKLGLAFRNPLDDMGTEGEYETAGDSLFERVTISVSRSRAPDVVSTDSEVTSDSDDGTPFVTPRGSRSADEGLRATRPRPRGSRSDGARSDGSMSFFPHSDPQQGVQRRRRLTRSQRASMTAARRPPSLSPGVTRRGLPPVAGTLLDESIDNVVSLALGLNPVATASSSDEGTSSEEDSSVRRARFQTPTEFVERPDHRVGPPSFSSAEDLEDEPLASFSPQNPVVTRPLTEDQQREAAARRTAALLGNGAKEVHAVAATHHEASGHAIGRAAEELRARSTEPLLAPESDPDEAPDTRRSVATPKRKTSAETTRSARVSPVFSESVVNAANPIPPGMIFPPGIVDAEKQRLLQAHKEAQRLALEVFS